MKRLCTTSQRCSKVRASLKKKKTGEGGDLHRIGVLESRGKRLKVREPRLRVLPIGGNSSTSGKFQGARESVAGSDNAIHPYRADCNTRSRITGVKKKKKKKKSLTSQRASVSRRGDDKNSDTSKRHH